MAEGYLKVTPEKLIQASNEFSTSGKTIASLTAEMMSIVNGLKSIWQGNAATEYSGKFNSLQDDIEKINRIIDEHVNDLSQMALEYEKAEEMSVEESSKLLNEVIG